MKYQFITNDWYYIVKKDFWTSCKWGGGNIFREGELITVRNWYVCGCEYKTDKSYKENAGNIYYVPRWEDINKRIELFVSF